MKILLYWRSKELLDLEVRRSTPPPELLPQDDGPAIRASGFLQDSSRAEPMEPDTSTFGFSRRTW